MAASAQEPEAIVCCPKREHPSSTPNHHWIPLETDICTSKVRGNMTNCLKYGSKHDSNTLMVGSILTVGNVAVGQSTGQVSGSLATATVSYINPFALLDRIVTLELHCSSTQQCSCSHCDFEYHPTPLFLRCGLELPGMDPLRPIQRLGRSLGSSAFVPLLVRSMVCPAFRVIGLPGSSF